MADNQDKKDGSQQGASSGKGRQLEQQDGARNQSGAAKSSGSKGQSKQSR